MVTAERKRLVQRDDDIRHPSEDHVNSTPQDLDNFRDSLPVGRWGPLLAVVLLTLIATFQLIAVFISISLKKPGSLATSENALYVMGTTILASCAATYASSQVRLLWARKLLGRSLKETGRMSTNDIAHVRTLLGLGTLREQLRFWSTTTALLLMGLLTTAMVASVTPSRSLVRQDAEADISLNNLLPCFYVTTGPSNDWFSWKLDNGSYLSFNTTNEFDSFDDPCTTRDVPGLFASLNTDVSRFDSTFRYLYGAGDTISYGAGDTMVWASAVGTPYARWRNTGFYQALGFGQWSLPDYASDGSTLTQYVDLLESATICSPVMTRNPVQCKTFSATAVSKDGINATTEDGCSVSSPIYSVDPTKSPATSFGVCTEGQSVGQATIVISSVHDHATKLGNVMRSDGNISTVSGLPSYSAVCTIDIAPTIALRSLQYTRIPTRAGSKRLGYSFELYGDNSNCSPSDGNGLSDILTDGTLAHGAAASYHTLSQNIYRDGWWDNLYRLASFHETYQHQDEVYVFNNSANALEDALGLLSAGGLSIYWGASPDTSIYGSTTTWNYGSTSFSGTQVGPGKKWAIVFIVPEVLTIVLLASLWWQSGGIS